MVIPSRSPNSSSDSRGGVCGREREDAAEPEQPGDDDGDADVPADERDPDRGDEHAGGRAEARAAIPASAASTSPGSIAWLSDSAA